MAKERSKTMIFRLFFLFCLLPGIVMLPACALMDFSDTAEEKPPQTEESKQDSREKKQEKPQPGAKEASEKSGRPETKLAGLSGKYAPEAEMAFSQARVLWKRSSGLSTLGEACSDPEKAISLLNKAISIEPRYGEAYVRRGMAFSEQGNDEKAFEDITAGIRYAPTAEAYAHRGLVLIRSGALNAARKDLEYSLQKAPSQYLAHNYMGVLALSEDNAKAACESFKEGCSKGDCSFLESARKKKICP